MRRAGIPVVVIVNGAVGAWLFSTGRTHSGLTLLAIGLIALVSAVTGGVGPYDKWRSRYPRDDAERAWREYVLVGAGFWVVFGVAGIFFAYRGYQQGYSWFSLLPLAGGVGGVALGCAALYFGLRRRAPK